MASYHDLWAGASLEDDPRGQEACDLLVQAVQYEGDTKMMMGPLLQAGEAAAKARSDAIQDAVNEPIEGLEEFSTVDRDKLETACEDAGVEIPD